MSKHYQVAGPNWKRVMRKDADGVLTCDARIRLKDGTDYWVWCTNWDGKNRLCEQAFDANHITLPTETIFPTFGEAIAAWERRMAELEKEHNISYQIIEVYPHHDESTEQETGHED